MAFVPRVTTVQLALRLLMPVLPVSIFSLKEARPHHNAKIVLQAHIVLQQALHIQPGNAL